MLTSKELLFLVIFFCPLIRSSQIVNMPLVLVGHDVSYTHVLRKFH